MEERKKSPWRFLIHTADILLGVWLLYKIVQWIVGRVLIWRLTGKVSGSGAASIGIIGGADGPTAIFVTSKFDPALLITAGIVILCALACLWVRHRKQKNGTDCK